MLTSEAIAKLQEYKTKYGDRPIHLEVGEDKTCEECGEPKYVKMCGMLKSVGNINIHGIGACAYLLADRG